GAIVRENRSDRLQGRDAQRSLRRCGKRPLPDIRAASASRLEHQRAAVGRKVWIQIRGQIFRQTLWLTYAVPRLASSATLYKSSLTSSVANTIRRPGASFCA